MSELTQDGTAEESSVSRVVLEGRQRKVSLNLVLLLYYCCTTVIGQFSSIIMNDSYQTRLVTSITCRIPSSTPPIRSYVITTLLTMYYSAFCFVMLGGSAWRLI